MEVGDHGGTLGVHAGCDEEPVRGQRGEIRDDIDPRLKAMEIIAFCYGIEAAWLVDPTIPVADAAAQWAAQQTTQLATRSATS